MSIIGEMYEKEIYKFREDLKERMEGFLVYLNQKMDNCDEGYFQLYNVAEEFKELFKNELK